MLQCSDIHPVTFFIHTRELISTQVQQQRPESPTVTHLACVYIQGISIHQRCILWVTCQRQFSRKYAHWFCSIWMKGSIFPYPEHTVSGLNFLFFNTDNLKKYVPHPTWVLLSGKVLSKQADRSGLILLPLSFLSIKSKVMVKRHCFV